jgi:hypothetical protein
MAGIAGDAHTPIYGYAWRAYFTAFSSAGVPTAVTAPDSEISLDGGTFADCSNEAVPIKEVGGATDSPNAYLDLTAAEMTCGCAHVQVKSSATVMQPIVIYPRVLPVWATGTAQAGGSATTIKLAAGAPAYDLCGVWVGIDSGTYAGQVRKIASYDPVNKVATVKRAFGGGPDGATYSLLVPEAMQGTLVTRAMLALPAFAAAAAGGLPTADSSNYVAGVLALGAQAKLDVNTEADTALSDIDLDHLVKVAKDTNWATTVTKESIIDLMTSKDTNQTFDRATDSAEARRDKLPANLEDMAITDTTGIVKADLVTILGAVITGTAAWIAAAFSKLFNVETPSLTAADAMRGTDGAYTGTPPSKADIATQVRTELATELARIDEDVSSRAAAGDQMDLVDAPNALAVTALQAGLALEATLTAIKGAGWSTETLKSIDALIDAIKAKTDLITVATAVTVTSPVASDGDVELYQGDDYANADGRALAWTNAAGSWPDLTGATVKLVVRAPNGDLIQVTGSVVTPTGAGQTVRVELTAAQTALLEEWPNASALRVVAWLSPSGRRTTLVDADLAVIEDLLD